MATLYKATESYFTARDKYHKADFIYQMDDHEYEDAKSLHKIALREEDTSQILTTAFNLVCVELRPDRGSHCWVIKFRVDKNRELIIITNPHHSILKDVFDDSHEEFLVFMQEIINSIPSKTKNYPLVTED